MKTLREPVEIFPLHFGGKTSLAAFWTLEIGRSHGRLDHVVVSLAY
ncbi:MAG TPA: hypothetical protein VKR31_05340 [Rhizomicrobium sp.]|nr:hypothetical protein [Rhizomicrobium sp.]